MTKPIDRLENEALRLQVADRARLARLLLESLDAADDQEEVSAAWEAEVARRVADYQAGSVATIPAADVFREAKSRIAERR